MYDISGIYGSWFLTLFPPINITRPLPKRSDMPAIDPERQRNLRLEVWRLSVPAVVEMVLASLVSIANMMMVGRLGAASITAVGLPQQPFMFAMALVIALNVGTTAIIARSIGAGRPELARQAFRQNWVLSGFVGLFLALVFWCLARSIVIFMGAEAEVVDLSAGYLRLMSLSIPFFTLSSTVLAALRGAGDTRSPMFITIVANSLIVILGLPLIYGLGPIPRLEVAGAGWALLLARLYMVTASTYIAIRPQGVLRLYVRGWRLNGALLRQTLLISLPSAAEQALLQAGLVLFIKAVAGMGTVTFAAHQILCNIQSLSWQPAMGFAVAATTMTGQRLGAGKPDEAEYAVYQAQNFALIIAFSMAMVFMFCGRPLLLLFTNDPNIIEKSVSVLRMVAFIQPFQAIQIVQAGGLRGAGATRLPLVSTVCGIWVVRNTIAQLTLNVLHMDLIGAWIALASDQFSRYLFIQYLFKRGRWKLMEMQLPAPGRNLKHAQAGHEVDCPAGQANG